MQWAESSPNMFLLPAASLAVRESVNAWQFRVNRESRKIHYLPWPGPHIFAETRSRGGTAVTEEAVCDQWL